MNNIKQIINSLLILLTLGCKDHKDSEVLKRDSHQESISSHNTKNNSVQETNQVVPDTTVNKKLLLSNDTSLQKFYTGNENIIAINEIRESPVIIFINKSKDEYLIAYQYEGSTKYAFECFEIGYFNDEKNLSKVKTYTISEENFGTETGIKLGMTSEELQSIKGNNFQKSKTDDKTIITYRNSDFETSSFLKYHNMPSYFMEFTLKQDKIVKIKFGFDYP